MRDAPAGVMPGDGWVLTLSCADRVGIVAAVTGYLAGASEFILDSQQFADLATGRFFMRVEFASGGDAFPADTVALTRGFAPIAEQFALDWTLGSVSDRPKMVIAVSNASHCLNDPLHRQRTKVLAAEIVAVIYNHDKLRDLAEWHGVPFHLLPVDDAAREDQERAILGVMTASDASHLVLAR